MKIPKTKPIRSILVMLMLLAPFNALLAQNYNVDGATSTCAGEPYSYRADPAGGTFKVWAVFGGTIVSGTIHTDEIEVVWTAGQNNGLSWVASHLGGGGDGGHKSVVTYEKVAPALSADCNLGSNLVNATSSSPAGATSWHWTFTGFGYSSAYTTTTSSPALNLYVPNASVPGTICVKAYYPVCGEYGASTCNSYP